MGPYFVHIKNLIWNVKYMAVPFVNNQPFLSKFFEYFWNLTRFDKREKKVVRWLELNIQVWPVKNHKLQYTFCFGFPPLTQWPIVLFVTKPHSNAIVQHFMFRLRPCCDRIWMLTGRSLGYDFLTPPLPFRIWNQSQSSYHIIFRRSNCTDCQYCDRDTTILG